MKIIDATDLKLGRLATYAAKQALEGEEIAILNAEKAVVTGNHTTTQDHYKRRLVVGSRYHGPFFPRMPDRIVKRAIRGMLPYKRERGQLAMSRIKTYIGSPAEFNGKEFSEVPGALVENLEQRKYLTIQALSKSLGAKTLA